nr:Sodium channel protein type 5 subunit alpha like [Ipomoea batatas]
MLPLLKFSSNIQIDVRTDFTSREAKGCPSTLGANRKSQDFFERVPARENHVKALFTEKVVTQIEKDIGSKIKIEEKFIIVCVSIQRELMKILRHDVP